MRALSFQNPIAISATVDAQRRLQLPKRLGLSAPLILIEFDEVGQKRLAFSNVTAVQEMHPEGLFPQVLRECNSLRPRIPNDICIRHSISPGSKVWLLTMNRWIEIWSEQAWDSELQQCLLGG
jgi:DNA-binding transcriptional regulator/RsmH inhibitor MraZ